MCLVCARSVSLQEEAGEHAVPVLVPSHVPEIRGLQIYLLVPGHVHGQATGRHLSAFAAVVTERGQNGFIKLHLQTQVVVRGRMVHKVICTRDSTSEAAALGIVVVVQVGEDLREADDASSLRIVVDPSSHAEGRSLCYYALTRLSWFSWLPWTTIKSWRSWLSARSSLSHVTVWSWVAWLSFQGTCHAA